MPERRDRIKIMQFKNFEQLDEPTHYCAIVENHFLHAFGDIAQYADCQPVIDPGRLEFAHGEYLQNIASFKVLLDSENPDQYKRAGALLHSLYTAGAIVGVSYDQDMVDHLDMNDKLGLSYDDAQHRLKLIEFYKLYANEMMAFDIAFRGCDLYEEGQRSYDYDFLSNVTYYLQANSALSVQSFAMIFKAFMFKP